ncbi:MAG: hypothetical protein GOVbin5663_30 [Prokaryotic dsDNA virus sp.]|nr:MAG: hypothetical protein GOVbin5663_30 [Prokaryotic dsDNA virus sp.]|tara:strand:+ start:1147 stop:2478 length:1332 start_codon:yes stop_codon:yes gene_type:complete
MIITNLTEKMLYDLLMDTIEEGYDKQMEERERLLDYYEGVNLQQDLKQYFDSESLSQIPPMYINLVRNIISRRALVYQQSPVRYNDKYNEVLGNFDSFMKQFEQLTYLLGTEALYTHWDDENKELKYRPIHFFVPFFKPNEDEPFAIMYQAESQLMARSEDAQYMFWSKETDDMEGKHFMISSRGKVTSVVPDDRNPYGDIIPFNIAHRHPYTRDFFREGANDLVDGMRSINIMLTELALHGRFQLGQPLFTGLDTEQRITMGQDKAIVLPEGANFSYASPSADINGMIESTKYMVDSIAQANNVRINWTDKAQESGLSKKMSELDLMDSLRSDTEQIYRPFEKQQFEIAKRICEVSGGINLGDQFSIDFSEREVPMSQQEEIQYYTWAFDNDLETRQSYLRKKNPDLQEEEIQQIVEQLDSEVPSKENETQSIIDKIGERVG